MKDIILYHGSRGGIVGDIMPKSRERCDFGCGFYMGTNSDQAKSLVANEPDPFFYRIKLSLSQISNSGIIQLTDEDWAYFVMYNRGRLEQIKGTEFYNKYAHLCDNKDVIIGPIADDAMNEAMRQFLKGDITDKVFLESIRGMDYGIQYVAKTKEACSSVEILSERELYGKELDDAINDANYRRSKGNKILDNMKKKYRREGLFFDEVLEQVTKEINPGGQR